jgi:superfamily II DNA or RNA helicase
MKSVEHGRLVTKLPDALYRKWRGVPGVAPCRAPLELLESMGLGNCTNYEPTADICFDRDTTLLAHQREACRFVLTKRRCIIAAETGLGKTRIALESAQQLRAYCVLVIGPAMTQEVWLNESTKWAPEYGFWVDGKCFREPASGEMVFCSYGKVGKASIEHITCVILDEIHSVKTHGKAGAIQSKEVANLLKDYTGPIIGLSATPMTIEPLDLWHQLDILYPGRFGDFYQFRAAYANKASDKYAYTGLKYSGLNPARADELQTRLESVMLRITKADLEQALPLVCPLVTSVPEAEVVSTVLASAAVERTCVVAYNRDTARSLAKQLDAVLLTGEQTAKARAKVIAELRVNGKLLVATMGAIALGVDLSFVTKAIFVQLYPVPGKMAQVVGRFHRLNSTKPVTVEFIVNPGTIEELYAYRLVDRLKDIGKLAKPTTVDDLVLNGIDHAQTDDEIFAQLRVAANITDDELGSDEHD